jgi:hypothetical protein
LKVDEKIFAAAIAAEEEEKKNNLEKSKAGRKKSVPS